LKLKLGRNIQVFPLALILSHQGRGKKRNGEEEDEGDIFYSFLRIYITKF